jgi:hypothetical protein
MYDRNTLYSGRVERCWGYYWKSVVDVNQVGLSSLDKCTQVTKAGLIPHNLAKYRKWILNICIGRSVQKNLVPMGSK